MYKAVNSGMGEYDRVQSFAWLYNPPPYDFLDKATRALPNFYAPASRMRLANDRSGRSGLGCPGCGGGCNCGMGQLSWGTVDWSLNSTDISNMFGFAIFPGLFPNWIFYAGAIAALGLAKGLSKK
jgi:hypothetical protein